MSLCFILISTVELFAYLCKFLEYTSLHIIWNRLVLIYFITTDHLDAAIEANFKLSLHLILVNVVLPVIVIIVFSKISKSAFSKIFHLKYINLSPQKQLPLKFLTALVQLLLVTTNFKSELHHMLGALLIKRHTVAIYDLSETPVKKGAPPIPQKRSKGFELCMNSKRRTISHRTSSNRHRKLQPFRYT